MTDNVERKPAKDGKRWRAKIAQKLRQPGTSFADNMYSAVQPAVFGVPLDKTVPSPNNEVCVLSAECLPMYFFFPVF